MYWLRARIHPTWQLTVSCVGIMVGVALAQVWTGFASWWWLALGAIMVALAIWRSRRMLLAFALIGGLLVGLYRGGVDQGLLAEYDHLIGKTITMTGKVVEDVSLSRSGMYSVNLSDISIDGAPMAGEIYVSMGDEATSLNRSDTVKVRGMLKDGFGSFAAAMQRAKLVSVERPVPGDVALAVRDDFAGKVRQGIDEPQASLGVGFLLGQKSSLPSDMVDALQVAGLTHIVVASGYNLVILVRLARRLFAKLSRYLTAVASGGMIAAFVAVTGMTPSMTRAGLVAALGIAMWYVGRKFHPVTLLAFAAAVTVLVSPSNVWGNVGWMLSFAAFAGVMIVGPIMMAYLFGKDKPPFVLQLLVETGSAQLATLPILAVVFGQISIISLLANLLVLPLIPFTMLLTFVAGLSGYVRPWLQQIAAWPAEFLLAIIVRIIDWCASIPGALVKWEAGLWTAAIGYAVIIGACLYMKWRSKYRLYSASVVD